MRRLMGAMLLGIGVGLLLSAGVVIGSTPSGPSRTQLIREARDLGMVFPEEVLPERTKPPVEPVLLEEPPPVVEPILAQPIQVIIPAGSIASRIGQLLEDAGLVDRQEFIKRVTEEGLANRLRAGTYTFPPGVNLDQVMEILIR